MSIETFATFVVIALGFIASPGPNVLLVISTSLSEGARKTFPTILGIAVAMAMQLALAALGTTWLVNSLSTGFRWLKWLGVLYLLYMGVQNLRLAFRERMRPPNTQPLVSFGRGFLVALTNPKTIVFFAAFLPQFVAPEGSYAAQITLLSAVFLVFAFSVNVIYAALAGRLASRLASVRARRWSHGLMGLLFLGAGSALAASHRVAS